jgi:hypothetical protein
MRRTTGTRVASGTVSKPPVLRDEWATMSPRKLEVAMSDTRTNRRFKKSTAALVSALAIGALALPLTITPLQPAKAQAWVQIGPFGFGVGGPYYYDYYGHPYYYPYYGPYYRPYYGPYYR